MNGSAYAIEVCFTISGRKNEPTPYPYFHPTHIIIKSAVDSITQARLSMSGFRYARQPLHVSKNHFVAGVSPKARVTKDRSSPPCGTYVVV